MHDLLVTAASFLCLVGASLGSLVISQRLPARYRKDDTGNIVRIAANIFVVATSLVLGLLLNSAKNTFEAVDRNVHVLATDIILLDRTLRHYGPEAAAARERLAAYVRRAVDDAWVAGSSPVLDDREAERLLDAVGDALLRIRPSDPARAELWRDAHASYQNVVKQRWVLIEESDGTIPTPFLVLLVMWLMLIFGSYGYLAPGNAVVVITLVLAALLLSGAVYLILDMDRPFSGTLQISSAPLERAIEQLRR
jgi:ABC-type multidrug transport system fused ATPase/permease subunit